MSKRLMVTSALPYANGSIHLGHLVGYIQTDVYARYRRALGDEVAYVCAADSHGTPIEVNAAKAGMAPRAFSEKYRQEHAEDFKRFGVQFSIYDTTDSEENKKWSWRVYRALKQRGLVYARSVEQLYCEKDVRFLPDRFVKGGCPKCGALEQYGDVCEKCGTTYDPRELVNPHCVLCGTAPVVRTSNHAYVNLRKVEPLIRAWVEAEGHLEPAVREQVKSWLSDLQDWCVTRDPPYFGFPVPPEDTEFAGKFLYVWVDAPIGYLSSGERYFAELAPAGERLPPAEYEQTFLAQGATTELHHFIGKDILRFHAVFWPAMLWATGLKMPDRMPVHGHLTVNGEKMSKSRGTFITARTYLDSGLEPELLRYYYCANLGPGIVDLDLALEEFRNRINADLANNIANLASRTCALIDRLGGQLEESVHPAIRDATRAALRRARAAYQALDYREVVRAATELASLCNAQMQEGKPWEQPSSPAAKALLYSTAKALSGIAVLLGPVMPRFCGDLLERLGRSPPAWMNSPLKSWKNDALTWTDGFDPFDGRPLAIQGKPPQIARLEAKQLERLIVVTPDEPQKVSVAASPAETASKASAKPAAPAVPGVIGYDDFARVELRVARILEAEPVPKADKLLKISVDVGEGSPRTIVAGIAKAYPDPAALLGKHIVVVANLEPRPLRGITSQGMLLAAGEAPNLQVVTVGEAIAPGTRVK